MRTGLGRSSSAVLQARPGDAGVGTPGRTGSDSPTTGRQGTYVRIPTVQVIFAVNDVRRSVAFYQGVFGWPRNELIDYREYVELHASGGTLGLCERDTYASLTQATPMTPENGDVSPAYLYVRVPDVREAIARLDEAGARPLAPLAPRSWGDEAAWFADPDGNVVAVAQASS
jgi:predicted enzyme related to lactoylglutathione lyase